MTEIKIGGRMIPLLYTTYEMIEIQKQLGCTSFELKDKVFGIKQEDEDDPYSTRMTAINDPEKMERIGKLIAILANAGLEEKGEKPDITYKWVLRNMKPALIVSYAIAAMTEITIGNMMEVKTEETGPVDEILEEQQAKKTARELTYLRVVSYGLIAGLQRNEIDRMRPGEVLDLEHFISISQVELHDLESAFKYFTCLLASHNPARWIRQVSSSLLFR